MKNSLFKLRHIAALGLMFSSTAVFAVDCSEPYKATSAQELTQRANKGDFKAIAELGSRYYYGRGGLTKDKGKALELWQKAAKMGSTRGQNGVGGIYRDNGDYAKAKEWYEKAAQNPNNDDMLRKAYAYEALARLYGDGKGVAKNLEKAFDLNAQAVQLCPNPSNELYLGWIYEQYKDYAQAKVWYEKAVKNPNSVNYESDKATATSNLANFYENGKGVEKNLDTALELRLQAENLNPTIGNEMGIGWIYRAKKEYKNAAEWYQKALNNPGEDNKNKAKASHQLAGLYQNGDGVSTDINKALELYLNADRLSPHNDTKKAIVEIYEEKGNSDKAAEWRAKIK